MLSNTPVGLGVDVEDTENGGDDLRAFRPAGMMTDGRDGAVSHFVHDGPRHGFDRIALLGREVGEAAQGLGYFAGTDFFELLLQADDGWGDFLHVQACDHLVNFSGNNTFGTLGFLVPLFQVRVDDTLEVVDVVEEYILQVIHGGIDVAGNGDIDQEHGPVLARADDPLHILFIEDVVGGSGRGDHDIDLGKHADEARVVNGCTVEGTRQFDCAVVGPVIYENVSESGT